MTTPAGTGGSRFHRALSWLAGSYGLLLLATIGGTSLWNIDEGRIAEVAREMAESGDFVVPRIGGISFPCYPPLAYWLMAASGSVVGFHEFGMRLPGALSAVGLVWLIGRIGHRLSGPAAGLGAALVLATTGGLYKQGSMCRADVLTTFFGVLAFERFLAIAEGPAKIRDVVLLYLACVLGVLAKGPIALVVAGAGFLAWLLVRRDWAVLRSLRLSWGIPCFLLAVIPWYLVVYRTEGEGFLRVNLMLENADAFVSGYQQRRPAWFYVGQLPMTAFPWILLLPAALWARRSRGLAVSSAWFGALLLFFTVSSAKRPSYLAYVYPAMALVAGTVLTDLLRYRPKELRSGVRAFAVLLAAGGVSAAMLPHERWAEKIQPALAYAPFALGGILVLAAALFISARKPRRAVLVAAGSLALGLAGFGLFLAPGLDVVGREGAAFCRRAAARGEPLSVMGPEETEGAFHFYVGATMPRRNGDPGLYILTEPQRDRLLASGRSVEILDRTFDERRRSKLLARVREGKTSP